MASKRIIILLVALCSLIVVLKYQSIIGQNEFLTNLLSWNQETEFESKGAPLSVDASSRTSWPQIVNYLHKRYRYLPIQFWEYRRLYFKNKLLCARFPNIYDLEFNNQYWQAFRRDNSSYLLYGAYYDNRKLNTMRPTIRILGMMQRAQVQLNAFCHIWFEGHEKPVITEVVNIAYTSKPDFSKKNIYEPFLMSCAIRNSSLHLDIPKSVSLVHKKCEIPKTNLKITVEKPTERKNFGVCVIPLDTLDDDLSVRLVEWIEIILSLGASKIFFYILHVHPNITKVLEYYEELGVVDVTPITLPGGQPNLPKLRNLYLRGNQNLKHRNELISINDCIYRNLYSYKYLTILDIDEIIVPVNTRSWYDLMQTVESQYLQIKNETLSCFCVKNSFFYERNEGEVFKHIPKYMDIMQRVFRVKYYWNSGKYSKCFYNTERVIMVKEDFPVSCLKSCSWFPVDFSDAKLQKYNISTSESDKDSRTNTRKIRVFDPSIWKHNKQVIKNTITTLLRLKYFKYN